MKKTQHLRRSQFILTYGPGSIIESENGPRIIPIISEGLYDYDPDNIFYPLAIKDLPFNDILEDSDDMEDAKIFEFPSNAYFLKNSENASIYKTYPFPKWKMCYSDKHRDPILFKGNKCPKCKNKSKTNVRFVSACTEGHLDDVDWNTAVHGSEKNGKMVHDGNCKSKYFYWVDYGSSLSSIIIRCPICGSSTTMGEIYKSDFKCSAWFPERESRESFNNPDKKYDCGASMKVIQRQSTALRIPETITLLKIPKYDNKLLKAIKRHTNIIKGAIKRSGENDDGIEFLEYLEDFGVPKVCIGIIQNEIESKEYSNFISYFESVITDNLTVFDVLEDEFQALKGENKCSDNFQKKNPIKKNFPYYNNAFDLRIFPIDLLKTVTIQKGYMRLPYLKKETQSKLIKSSVKEFGETTEWYPSFESMGEGIFVTSKTNPLKYINEDILLSWRNRENSQESQAWQGNQISWRNGNVKNPQFIWWHTFSHALIRAISLNSGYSSASLRERIYIDSKAETGGLLIYTTFAGEDGGMGGLTESIDSFDEILEFAWKSLMYCSNDPLCYNLDIDNNRVNGAACHSCLMLSETSCEHGNKWLDRHVLLNDYYEK